MEMNEMENLQQVLTEQILNLVPAPEPTAEEIPFQDLYLDGTEPDNSRWRALLEPYLAKAKTFEIHCWNEETEWVALALQYGTLKETDWQYGQIITGAVTPEFCEMLLSQPKPADTEIYNKMTPFFTIVFGNTLHSSHYGTEIVISKAIREKETAVDRILDRMEDIAIVHRNIRC